MVTNGYDLYCWQTWPRVYGIIMPFWRPAVGLGYHKWHSYLCFGKWINAVVKQQAHIKPLTAIKMRMTLQLISLNFSTPGAKYNFHCVTINVSLTPFFSFAMKLCFPACLSHNTTSQMILDSKLCWYCISVYWEVDTSCPQMRPLYSLHFSSSTEQIFQTHVRQWTPSDKR